MSALDATSRVLVFEAIKRWRANKMTVVITHDLSQISTSDFVYVLKHKAQLGASSSQSSITLHNHHGSSRNGIQWPMSVCAALAFHIY
jgi:ABC-type multidrug transport system fused ATPase/permease subunit